MKYLSFSFFKKHKKIFNISSHRTGTTSFGDFLEQFGFKRSSYKTAKKNNWSVNWYDGEYDLIFDSKDFKNHQVFEDDPWYFGDFYIEIYKRYPQSKFILVDRPADDWFRSMMSHSNGKSLGNTMIHAKIYGRIEELNLLNPDYFNQSIVTMKPDNLLPLDNMKEHYINYYNKRNIEIKAFFAENAPNNFLLVDLYSKEKWIQISEFLNFRIPENYDIHSHKSKS